MPYSLTRGRHDPKYLDSESRPVLRIPWSVLTISLAIVAMVSLGNPTNRPEDQLVTPSDI
jgi:hypothetical protein